MKTLVVARLLLLLPAVAHIQLSPPPVSPIQVSGEGRVEGVVKRQHGGEPISGVTVTLTAGSPGPPDAVSQRTTITDSSGRFLIENLSSGRYNISIRRDGYLFRQPLSGAINSGQVVIGQGRSVSTVAFSMVQGGTISGRILDPAGRPAATALVTAARVFYDDGRPILGPAKTITTDDRGDYRLFWLEPGEYLVIAEKSLPTGPAKGYFPGGDDARAAINVTVGEGADSSRIDFSLGRTPASVIVSGSVTVVVPGFETRPSLQSRESLAPQTPAPADLRAVRVGSALQFYLLPLDAGRIFEGPALIANTVTDSQDKAAGKFELRNVRSGSYELYAVLQDRASSPSKYYVGHRTIDVGTENLGGVALLLAPGIDLKGTIRAGTGISGIPVRVSLRPRTTLPGWTGTTVTSTDGTFSIPNIPESQYSIFIEPSEPNAYVAALLQGRDDILDRGIVKVAQTSPDSLEALIQAPASTIRGTVMASPQQLAGGIMVTLVPEESRRENLSLYKRAIAINGTFSIAGVAPGKYKVLAWERIPDGAEQNAEFMEAYRSSGVEVLASAGNTSSIEVRLTPE
jgi:sarcosine oxidase gamma subunit